MDRPDVNALAKQMIEAVRGFVAKSETAINAKLADLEARISSIPAGPRGEKGDKGDAGESIKGEKGDPGKDADAAAIAALIPKPKDGKDADPEFIRSEIARAVAALPVAKDGKDGKDGASIRGDAGKDGEDGRDAAELDILPSLDEAKSYRRGTWASHNGGLIRSSRQTDPIKDKTLIDAGWVVMVEGLAGVVVTQGDDPRVIEVGTMLTSGVKAVSSFSVPMVIDKGVWREGRHEKGDHVSWDGSGWIAQKATTDKPGTSDAWRLSTKRGRDGKDGGTKAAPVHKIVRTA